jgi:hypothetical protein
MGEWPPLIQPQIVSSSLGGKNQVLNKLLSSKQKLLPLTSSLPTSKTLSFSPSPRNNLQEDGNRLSSEENNILKKFIPSPKVGDAFLFRKSADKDDDESEKDGFFKRLLRDNRSEDEASSKVRDMLLFWKLVEKDDDDYEKNEFFKRLLRDNKSEDEELTSSSEGFFKKLFRDSKSDSEDKSISKSVEEDEMEGFFRTFFKEKLEGKKDWKDGKGDEDIGNLEEK